MTEPNSLDLTQTDSVKDILDSTLEMFFSESSEMNAPPRCSFAETHDPSSENFDISEFASSLQAALQGLEFLNSFNSSVPDVNSNSDSMVDVSYCVQKKLTGLEAANFLKNFRRTTPDFDFPFQENPVRRRAQHKWLVSPC